MESKILTSLNILIVDDEQANREALGEILSRMGHCCKVFSDGKQAYEFLVAQMGQGETRTGDMIPDLIISDLRMPVMDGAEFFHGFQKAKGKTPRAPSHSWPLFAFATAYGTLDEAVSLLRAGAVHFLRKPIKRKDLVELCQFATSYKESHILGGAQKRSAPEVVIHPVAQPEVRHGSSAMGKILQVVDQAAATKASVVIIGESGTGKELIARRLHGASPRAKGTFVAVHAAAIPETLLESELFGFERGAFTGADHSRVGYVAQAHQGTLFLDELTSIPLSVQAKLLRVIQEGELQVLGARRPVKVDVRWVAACNEDPKVAIQEGRLREDLWYRLSVLQVVLPALRHRMEDLDQLVEEILHELRHEGFGVSGVQPEAMEVLRRYGWPGNIRELRNVLERGAVLSSGSLLDRQHLPEHIQSYGGNTTLPSPRAGDNADESTAMDHLGIIQVPVGTSLRSVEDQLIAATLKACHGDKAQAAKTLGVHIRTIYRWLDRGPERGVERFEGSEKSDTLLDTAHGINANSIF